MPPPLLLWSAGVQEMGAQLPPAPPLSISSAPPRVRTPRRLRLGGPTSSRLKALLTCEFLCLPSLFSRSSLPATPPPSARCASLPQRRPAYPPRPASIVLSPRLISMVPFSPPPTPLPVSPPSTNAAPPQPSPSTYMALHLLPPPNCRHAAISSSLTNLRLLLMRNSSTSPMMAATSHLLFILVPRRTFSSIRPHPPPPLCGCRQQPTSASPSHSSFVVIDVSPIPVHAQSKAASSGVIDGECSIQRKKLALKLTLHILRSKSGLETEKVPKFSNNIPS